MLLGGRLGVGGGRGGEGCEVVAIAVHDPWLARRDDLVCGDVGLVGQGRRRRNRAQARRRDLKQDPQLIINFFYQSINLYIHLSIYLSVYLYIYLFIYLSIHIYIYVYISIYLIIDLTQFFCNIKCILVMHHITIYQVYRFIYLPIYVCNIYGLSIHLSTYLSFPSIYLSTFQSIYLPSFIYQSIQLRLHVHIFLYIYLILYLSIYLNFSKSSETINNL